MQYLWYSSTLQHHLTAETKTTTANKPNWRLYLCLILIMLSLQDLTRLTNSSCWVMDTQAFMWPSSVCFRSPRGALMPSECLPSTSHKHSNQLRLIMAKLVLTHDCFCGCHTCSNRLRIWSCLIRLLVPGGSVPRAGAALCGGHGVSAGSSSRAQYCGGMRKPQATQLPVSLAHTIQWERYRWDTHTHALTVNHTEELNGVINSVGVNVNYTGHNIFDFNSTLLHSCCNSASVCSLNSNSGIELQSKDILNSVLNGAQPWHTHNHVSSGMSGSHSIQCLVILTACDFNLFS